MKGSVQPEVVRDIKLYLAAHKWRGAKHAIAKKYGISISIVCSIYYGRAYRGVK